MVRFCGSFFNKGFLILKAFEQSDIRSAILNREDKKEMLRVKDEENWLKEELQKKDQEIAILEQTPQIA